MKTILIVPLVLLIAGTSCEKELQINTPPVVQQQPPPPPPSSTDVNLEFITLTASAGSDQVLALPANSCALSGSSNYAQTYSWRKVYGPSSKIDDPLSQKINLTNMEKGIYEFELTVTSRGQKAKDSVRITVQESDFSNEIVFQDQQWSCPMECSILIEEIHTRVPKGLEFKVYVQRDNHSQWVEVVDGTRGTGFYTWHFYDTGLKIVLNQLEKKTDTPDVKIVF